jgi:hypothetical protein
MARLKVSRNSLSLDTVRTKRFPETQAYEDMDAPSLSLPGFGSLVGSLKRG